MIANHGGAKIYSVWGVQDDLELVLELPNPKGTIKGREINTDRPGRLFKSLGENSRSGVERESPHEIIVNQFAKQLATTLENGLSKQEYGNLIIVADPHLLGRVKECLHSEVSKVTHKTISKNLIDYSDRELKQYLSEVIEDAVRDRFAKKAL